MRLTAPTLAGPGDSDSAWLNTPPLHRDMFYGRVTAVVFWAIHCEASARLLGSLEERQRSMGPGLAVIAVHSPRFADQIDEVTVRAHVEQMRLRVPVLHDPKLIAWGLYDPPGWPSIMLIDHDGRVIGSLAGAPDAVVDSAIETAMASALGAQAKEGRVPRPLPVPTVAPAATDHELRYPTGIAPIGDDRIAVVDSGNNRVLVGSLDLGIDSMTVETIIGGFDRPDRVVALDAQTLAVSEPVNGRVMLASIGDEPGIWPLDLGDLATPLLRPVGLGLDRDHSLVIADAGRDVLVRVIDAGVATQSAGVVAGSGVSGARDGRASHAELSQPVAIAATEAGLTFCELAGSRIRLLTDNSRVLTSSSQSGEIGLKDGPLHRSLFDRPSGLVALADGSLIVVEQGSGRLRSLRDRNVSTFGVEAMASPTDLMSPDGDSLVVTDTLNHRLVSVNRNSKRATPLKLSGLVPQLATFDFGAAATKADFDLFNGETPDPSLETVPVVDPSAAPDAIFVAGGTALSVGFPALGSGPWKVTITAEPSTLIETPITVTRSSSDDSVSVRAKKPGTGTLVVMVSGSVDGHRSVQRHTLEVCASDSPNEANQHRSTSAS